MPTPQGYSKYKLIISLILSIVFLTTADIYGQDEYFVPKSGQQVLQVCNAIIYDAGGPNNPYDNNWNGSLVLAPISSGNAISIHGTISTCPYDYDSLFIYEGIGTSGTLLLQCCSDWSPYNIPTITANNPQGALTILFKSNNSCTGDGFELFVECVPDQNVNINPEQFEEQPSCLEFTDLTSPSVTCTWGKHANGGPFNTYANTGVVTGRHTVIRDTTLYDNANTWGGKISALRCVCPGDTASICLGNSLGASNALGGSESISYEYTVDTSNGGYDLLILKYAAVLEDPNHTAVEQPQFIFQILDENNNLIDPTCGKAEFYAGKNTSTGWQQQGDIYWKDWTHVGIDVSQYHGQTIRIRLSTFDCIYTAHFGYAYFSFGCAKRKITVETCGNVQTNDYGAPEGFTYKWYYSSAPGVTLSTDRVYTAPVYQQNGELLCDVAFIDNPDCKFTLKAVTRPRYPLADFGIDRAGCNYTVFLHDSSATSADQLTPDGSGDHCDNLFWDFGDGNVSQMTNPTAYYTSAGVYNITLIASIANGQCKDTITKTITLYPSHINITGDASICLTKSTTLTITDWGDYIWSTGDTTHSITVSPSQNTTYTVERADPDSICPSNGSFMVSVQQPQTTYIYDTIFGNTPYYYNGQPFYSAGYNIFYEHTNQNCDSTIFLTLHHQVTIDTSICKGSEYFFDGQYLHTPGTYEQVIHFPQGYDSITILKLGLCDTFFFTSSATICDNKSYQWRDTLLKNLTPGTHVFYDSLKTQNGCDSIFQLILKVNGHNVQTITPSICAGGSYYFSIDGNSYSNAGTYSVFKDLHGQCEQEFKLILTVNPKYNFYDTVTICDNESYTWRDIEWYPEDADEDIQDLLKTKLNCDSIYHLTLRVSPTYFYQEQATICAGDTLIWHGLSLTKADTYYDSLQTSTGCDSVYQLTLTVNDSYHFTQTHTMCSNDTLKWHGFSLTKTGTYYDSLKTSTGCDSIYTLSLTVNQAYLFTFTDTICENDTMYWHGLAISTAGTYYDSLKTQLNCDSVYEIKIITKHHNVHTTYETICDGQQYYYPEDGQIYAQNGTYSIFKPMGDICDDEFQLVLTVNPVYNYYDTVTICDNEIYQWRNHTYKELPQGEYQYKDSFATHLGCDSIYHLKLIVLKSYLFTTQDTICENDTLIWHGQALTKAGSYFAMYSAYNGCDSIYQLDLALADTFLIQEYDTICDNDTLIWHGRALTTAGNYYDSLLSKHGCDSIHLLTLTVHDTYFFEEYDTICDGDSRKWHGQTLSATGTYYDSLLSKHGCDSIYQLSLYVQDSYFFQEYDTICDNDTLMWHGQALNSPSTYFAMYNTKAGCDSIYQLNLEIASTYFFQEYDTICDNDTLTWHGQQLTAAGTYHDSLQAAHGCDSVYWIDLTVHPTYFFQEYDTICDHDTIKWHGQKLTAAGTYHDSLLTSHGCDSVYWLTLTVEPTYFFQEYDTICDNDTITWHGQDLNKQGTYFAMYNTKVGCDSIYQIDITTKPTYFFQEYDTICDNDTLTWHGQKLTTAGTYHDSLLTSRGCDSVYWITLTVHPTFFFQEYDTICDNDTITWHGQQLTTAGTYHDSLLTSHGCDSVYWLTLTVHSTYFFQEYDTICDNDTLTWHGQQLTTAGTYHDSLLTSHGCDSVYWLTLTVHPTYFFQEHDTICDNDTLTWHGQQLTTAGTYHDSLLTSHGCDSVYWLTLTVHSTYFFQEYDTICDNDTLTWHGQQLTTADTYHDSLLSTYGCDSVYWLTLTVHSTYFFQEYDTICDNDTLTWHGQQLTTAGTYYDSLFTTHGCDSVYQMDLYTNPSFYSTEQYTISDHDSVIWHNQIYKQTGIYFDSAQTIHGCDSIYELDLTVNPTFFFPETDSICNGDTVYWRNMVLTVSGIYDDSLKTTEGEDSIYRLTLTVHPTYDIIEYDTICDNDTLMWHGQQLTIAGTYYDSLLTTNGCDSFHTIVLTVNKTYFFHEYDTICDNQPLAWHGQTLSMATTYHDSLLSSNGCDSVYWIDITVNPTYFFQEYDTICDNDTLTWHGQQLTTAGTYHDSLLTSHGCDSVYWITLTVHPTYFFQEYDTICDNDTLTWHGQQLTSAGTYHDSLLSSHNCDSVYWITLTVHPTFFFQEYDTICDNDTLTWHGQKLTSAGTYHDSLLSSHGCDSIYKIDITTQPTYFFQEYDTICDNDTLTWHGQQLTTAGTYHDSLLTSHGCDSVYWITLTVHPTFFFQEYDTICDNDTLTWHGQQLTTAGTYHDSLLSSHSCDSVYWITLTVHPTYFFQEYDTICDNDTLTWHGQKLTSAGTYHDSLVSSHGCDSIYKIDITTQPTYFFQEYDTICDNDTLTWHGQQLTTAGTYHDSLLSSHGCDSVYWIDLTVHQTYFFQEYDTICDNDTLTWHGQQLTTADTYHDSLLSSHGCDSVYWITLTVHPTFFFQEYDTICDNDTITWHGQQLTTAGTYHDSLLSSHGCDSVYWLDLTVHQTYFFQEYDTICDNDTLTWHGQQLTTAGTYHDSLLSSHGCDSIFWIDLTVNKTYFFQEYDTICDNDTLTWHGQQLTTAGTHRDSLLTTNGCDSVYWIDLTVHPTYFFHEHDTIGDNQVLTWHGQTLDSVGTYYDSLLSSHGCDSVYWITLTVHPTFFFQEYDTICDNDTLTWHGQQLTTAGTYHDSLLTINNCDSVYWLTLTVHKTYFFQEYDTICDNDTLMWHGQQLTIAGAYHDSLLSSHGCDSIYWIDLTVHQTYFFQEYDTICDNDTLTWHGQQLTTAGTYHDSLLTSHGCDSVYWITLTVHPTFFFQEYDTICDNDTLTWHGQQLTIAGTYHDSLLTANNCDSVYWITLTVHPTYFFQEYDTICDNDTLTWHGQQLTTAGAYHDSLLSSHGCDSIYWLDLTVHPTYFFQEYDTICDNDTLTWHGQQLTIAGTYHDSLLTSHGCDSVYWITLTVHPTYFFQEYDTICDNDTLTWHGQQLTIAGTYHDSLLTANNCDSVYWIDLIVHPTYFFQEYDTICDNDTLTWHGQQLTTAGTYYDSLLTSHGCDSVYWIDLTVYPTYFFQEYDTICDNDTLTWHSQQLTIAGTYHDSLLTSHGCDSVYWITLTVHPTYFFQEYDTICDNDTLTWHGQQLTIAGSYHDSLLSSNGCDSIYWIDLTVHPTYFFQEYDTICDNDTLTWHGQQLTVAGTYHDSLLTSHSCDSVYWITLTVHPTFFFQSYDTICDNDTLTWHGQQLTTAGTYHDSLLTSHGCDSVYWIDLTVHQTYFFQEYDTVCDNHPLLWHGQTLTATGNYYDSLLSSHGCDSVYWLDLTVHTTYLFREFDTICNQDTATWRNMQFTQAGVYNDSLLTENGCDSVYQLILHVHPTYFFHLYDTICDNQTLTWHGMNLSIDSTYYDSLLTTNGCDSVYWLELTVMPTYFFQEYDTICDNHPLLWHGQTLTATGSYYDSLQSFFGCDSVYWIDLIVNPTYNIYDTVEICNSDLPYHYAPEDTVLSPNMSAVTNYKFEHTSIFGCDSIVYLRLVVYDTFSVDIYDTICQWETYTENGFNLEEQNDEGDLLYHLPLQTEHGCDSTVHLHLYVKKSYDIQLYDVVCQGYTYHKDGFILPPQYQSGELTYQQFLHTQENCDSIITLNLSVTDLEVEITQVNGDLCNDGFVTLEVQTTLLDFVWSTGDTSRQITVDNSGWYTVHVEAGECAADAGFTIEPCTLELFIPNAFSPTRVDGINDEFYINWPALSNVEKFEINIYDRWGKLAFHSKDPHFRWDGKINGKTVPANHVFTYKVFILGRNGFDYVYKGTITIL